MNSKYFFAIAAALVFCLAAYGQFSSTIDGTVTDPSGDAIPDATVKVTNVATGVVQTTATSSSGVYRVPSLPPGVYRVTASKEGFNTVIQENVTLESVRVQTVPISMKVGALATQVTVTEAPPAVETTEARVSQLTEARPVMELPMNGRNALNVVAQTPGVTGTGAVGARIGANDIFASSGPRVTANGQRQSSNAYYIDDTSTNDNPDQGSTKLVPSPEAIQEVRVSVNNYSAVFGRNSSILTQIYTKGGANEIHGSVFEYHTNNKLSARNTFQNTRNAATGRVVPSFNRNQFGGSVGGPIKKDHTFLFANWEGLRSTVPNATVAVVETPQFTNFMRQTFANRISTQLLTRFPGQVAPSGPPQTVATRMQINGLGACSGTGTLGMPCDMPLLQPGVIGTALPRDALQWSTRADQIFGTGADRLYFNFFRMTRTDSALEARPAFSRRQIGYTYYANLNYTHTFSPTFVNEMAVGFVRNYGEFVVPFPSVPRVDISGEMQRFSIQFFNSGVQSGPSGFVQNDFHWRDLASINRGSHGLKLGFDIFHDQDNAPFTRVTLRPAFVFANVFEFAADNPLREENINYDPRTGGPPWEDYGFRATTYGFFVQDDWKMKPNFSINMGVRWDFTGNPTMREGRLTNLVLGNGSTFQERIAGAKVAAVDQLLTKNHVWNFAPRFGFAWDPFKNGKMSIRSGVGIFYDRYPNKLWTDATRPNPPYLAAITASRQVPSGPQPLFALGTSDDVPYNFPLPPGSVQAGLNAAGGPSCAGCRAAVGGTDPSLSYAYAQNWFLGVQYALTPTLVVEGDYMGSNGKHLYNNIDRNTFVNDLVVNKGSLARLNPNFAVITYGDNAGNSSFQGGTFAVRKRMAQSSSFQVSYTFGKSIDTLNRAGGGGGALVADVIDAYNVRRQKGLSDNDIAKKLAFNFLYDLPRLTNMNPVVSNVFGGWTVSGMAILQGGYPFTVYTNAPFRPVFDPATGAVIRNDGGDYNANGINFDLPNTPSFGNSKSAENADFRNGLFAVSDFPRPTNGLGDGNLGRNTFRGPGMANVDTTLLKNFGLPWREQMKLQFRAEFYNVFNRVNFSNFETNLTSGNFGKSTATFTPRAVQFVLRFQF